MMAQSSNNMSSGHTVGSHTTAGVWNWTFNCLTSFHQRLLLSHRRLVTLSFTQKLVLHGQTDFLLFNMAEKVIQPIARDGKLYIELCTYIMVCKIQDTTRNILSSKLGIIEIKSSNSSKQGRSPPTPADIPVGICDRLSKNRLFLHIP